MAKEKTTSDASHNDRHGVTPVVPILLILLIR